MIGMDSTQSAVPTIRVMRIIARLNVGGPAIHCTSLSQTLAKYGFETTLVTGTPENDEASFEKVFGFEVRGFKLVRLAKLKRSLSFAGDLRTLYQLIVLMRRDRPQIVHTHTAKAGMLGRVAAAVSGVPIVIHTYHGHVLSGYFSRPFSWVIQQVERTLALRTDAIVTLSESLKTELAVDFKVAPESKFKVIQLGRDLKEFFEADQHRGELRRELGLPPPGEAFVIGTIGRFVPIKNQSLLLRAFAQLRADSSLKKPCYLLLAGEGKLALQLKSLARNLGIENHVLFLGWRSDLARIYADIDVFALSSLNEGTPLSIIESFASGCPVVSTRVGGIADMFTQTAENEYHEGALVPSGDPALLAAALSELLSNDQRRHECSAAARIKGREFTAERLTERMATLYTELLKRPQT